MTRARVAVESGATGQAAMVEGVGAVVMVKVVIDDWILHETRTVMAELNESQDEMSFVQGMAAALQASFNRYVNVDQVDGVWYITIEDAIEVDES